MINNSWLTQYFEEHKRAISAVLAVIIAVFVASYHWSQQREWLNQVTLEVQATSATLMRTSNPSQGALWLKTEKGEENLIGTTDWTSSFAKPFSRFRFDFPLARYDAAIFFPDPSVETSEIMAVRLIPHGGKRVIDVPLDRVESYQNLETGIRTPGSIAFKKMRSDKAGSINLRIADLLQQIPSPSAPSPLATVLVFLTALLTAFWLAGLVTRSSSRATPILPAGPAQAPFVRFGIILGVVVCMAALARPNSSSDEYLHVEAARYYIQHWLPPSLSSEWVIPSISHYGVSYLAGSDMGYFFAGKFALFLGPFFPGIFTALRFFNVALLVLLVAWSSYFLRGSPATWIFFLTPQLWYIFSSYNTEAWGIFVSLLLMGQLMCEQSSLKKYLASPLFRKGTVFLLLPLGLSCLLTLTKTNFILVFVFFVTWLVWREASNPSEPTLIRRATKIIPLVIIPLMLPFGLQTYQNAVNDHDLPRVIHEQQEKYAHPWFKPSATNSLPDMSGLRLKERGVTLRDYFARYHQAWLNGTLVSFVGVYGWMRFYSPALFYVMMALGWSIVIGSALVATFTKPPRLQRIFYIVAWLNLPLIMALSMYHSWTADFQPQGRYLFPFLPILFYLIYAVNPGPRWLLAATTWGLFMISVYSFIFVGLRSLAH